MELRFFFFFSVVVANHQYNYIICGVEYAILLKVIFAIIAATFVYKRGVGDVGDRLHSGV